MQSKVDGPANPGYVQLFKVFFNLFASCLHKLLFGILSWSPFSAISLPERSPVLTKKEAEEVDNQLNSVENVPLHLLLQKEFTFQVDENITSSATRVMFSNSDRIMNQICLKMWRECHNGVYDTGDLRKRTMFLLEGLAFNGRLSENIYYGIVPVLAIKPDRLECGPLIENPIFANLAPDRPYALVMKRLKEEWRLDQQLQPGKLDDIRGGMEFLAHQIAMMHQNLSPSLRRFGTPKRIANKLEFNIEQFHRVLDERRANPHIMAGYALSKTDMESIASASDLLRQFSKLQKRDFKKRRREGHIRRCHGDLKAANLWICPSDESSPAQKRLIALDCVDFNPEFCNIDTLSDVAMLAVDLEMRLENVTKNSNEEFSAQQHAYHFLQMYLQAVGEKESVWPLLEYYMTEKAMVCAYMSIVYDDLPRLGEKYLKVVLAHSQVLAKHLSLRQTKELREPE